MFQIEVKRVEIAQIIERVQEKMQEKRREKISKITHTATQNASKPERMVSFHWSNYQDGHYVSVGKRDYGGVREMVAVPKEFKPQDLIEKALSFYFDGGVSTKGEQSDFQFSLSLDARGKKRMGKDETVDDVIKIRKIRNPTFYLLSKNEAEVNTLSDTSETDLPNMINIRKRHKTHSSKTGTVVAGTSSDSTTETALPGNTSNSTTEAVLPGTSSNNGTGTVLTGTSSNSSTGTVFTGTSSSSIAGTVLTGTSSNSTTETVPTGTSSNSITEPVVIDASVNGATRTAANQQRPDIFIVASDDEVNQPMHFDDNRHTSANEIDSSVCAVRRGNMFEDLLRYILNEQTNINTLKVKVIAENGEDSGGVLRDCLTEFWETFYLRYTVGDKAKVPITVHTLGSKEWEAIGQILVLGFKTEGYFPVLLAQCWITKCIYGGDMDEGELVQAFLTPFLPAVDRDILQCALEKFEEVDFDELVEVLSQYEGRVQPADNNMWKVVNEIAHHQLVQKPSFVTECWALILQHMIPLLNKPLSEIYDELIPTSKKVLKILKVPSDNLEEKKVGDAIKRYVKNCSESKLQEFLRYCTGSNLLIVPEITVNVTPQSTDFERRPIARTCGCVLDLPTNYIDFMILREDFDNILDKKILFMDIV